MVSVKQAICQSVTEAWCIFKYKLKSSLYSLASLVGILLPSMCVVLVAAIKDDLSAIQVILVAAAVLVVELLLLLCKDVVSRMGKGNTVPVPAQRFTEVGKDGEVTVTVDRMQELLLYMADLEDYLQAIGKI